MPSPTNTESAEALKEAKDKLDKLGIPFCLFLGTALGAYRDKDFCPGDTDDIDIAIDIKYYSRLKEIQEEFKDWFNEHNWLPEDNLCPESSFKKLKDEYYIKVDMFFLSEMEGKMAWRFFLNESGSEYATRLFDKKHFDTFDKVYFHGEEYYVPGQIEEYLEDNYGNWRTPIHRDNWNWSKDNKCEQTIV